MINCEMMHRARLMFGTTLAEVIVTPPRALPKCIYSSYKVQHLYRPFLCSCSSFSSSPSSGQLSSAFQLSCFILSSRLSITAVSTTFTTIMGIGKISEDVFLRVLPPGITATVKSAKITYPEPKEGWYALWTHGNHSIKDTNDVSSYYHSCISVANIFRYC
jgi:hypothetical protein